MIDGTSVGTTLFVTWEWSESAMLAVERGAAWTLLAVGIAMMLRPVRALLAAIAVWFTLLAVLSSYQGGYFGHEYSVLAHATRIMLPLALLALIWPTDDHEWRRELAGRLLRIAVAVTFATHGIEALEHHPEFIDFVITAFRRVGIAVTEPTTRVMLTAIGVQDLFLAALVLTNRWRAVAAYMAFWGLLTAGARIVHLGLWRWPATVVRAANWAVPLALYFLWAAPDHGADEHEDGQRPEAA